MSIQEAQYYAEQSTCIKRKVGCVVVKNNEIIAYGFNHGYDEQCICSLENKNPHVLHAEEMALQGTCDIYRDSYLYVTYQPCDKCAALIVSKHIKKVFYAKTSKCSNSLKYLSQHGISTYLIK